MALHETAMADAYHSIKAGLDVFKQPPPGAAADAPGKAALTAAAERVKTEASKIGLLCSGGAPPSDQLASLAAALQQACVAFVSTCHAAGAAAGPSLRQELQKSAQGVVQPALALVKDMASGKDLKLHVGAVWDGVGAVSKLPADNKACIFQGLAGVVAVLKDTSREMEELQQQQEEQFGPCSKAAAGEPAAGEAAGPSASAEAAAAGDGGQAANGSSSGAAAAAAAGKAAGDEDAGRPSQHDDGDDLDYEAEEMSHSERRVLGACLGLLAASSATLKAFARVLLQGPALAPGAEALEGWESCLFHAKHLRRAAEDLGAAMYPPQDAEEVASASLAVFEVTELMADECPDPEAVGTEQLSALAAQLTAAHERMQQLLGDTAAEQGGGDACAGSDDDA